MSRILTLHDPGSASHFYREGYWQRETLYDLVVRNALRWPERYALRDSARRLTWRALKAWVDLLAGELAGAGLRSGDRVSVWLPNRAETIVVTLACSRNGYVCNPSLHQTYTVDEVTNLLTRIGSVVLFAQPGFGADATQHDIFEAAHRVPGMRRVYRLEPVATAGAPGYCAPQSLPPASNNPDKIVLLAFTSGTTGEPKGVMHSDNTLLANARAMARDWHHHEEIVLFSMSPLTHAIGTIAMAQSLVSGFELVVNDLPSGRRPLDWIVETGATYLMGVPTHAIDILADLRRRGWERPGRVKVFYMGGAALPSDTARAFIAMGVTPQNVYGMTENGAHQYTLPDDDPETIVATTGRASRGYEVKIWRQDDPDAEVAPGEIGEIGGRGANLMLGYFDNQAATEQAFNRHGWFLSGDHGRLDGRGCLEVVGRKKDIIIRGGRNIHPARIEDLARGHPAVLKSAAFAVADERLGERVCLAVMLQPDARLDPDDLLRHLAQSGLSRYDMPERFVALDEFPLTASGKILKREMVQWVRSGRIRPRPVRWTGNA